MYAIFYSFFEVFPLVYATGLHKAGSPTHGYGLNAGEIGLIFLSITVGVSISIPSYMLYLHYIANPEILAHLPALPPPEKRMIPALFTAPLITVGLFMFAWTGFNSPDIHWIVPTIGVVIVTIGIFIVFQCIFIYVPLTYPQYSASLFAGNGEFDLIPTLFPFWMCML